MSSNNRAAKTALILMSSAYFLAFIPTSLTGAKDLNMLTAFRKEIPEYGTDEGAIFEQTKRLTTLGGSPIQTIKNMLGNYYNHAYGYLFFLVSALAIFPLRVAEQFFHAEVSTTAYMVIVRQMSPLFMLIAINLFVYLWTGFKSLGKSVLLFLFLASVPAIFFNNMFWHPDSLATLFVVLTIFCLSRDDLRFGNWFYAAAISCGLATGTKVIGLFFFLSIPVYLLLGLIRESLSFRTLLKHAAMFLLLMALAIVASNPLILLPGTATQYVGTLSGLAGLNAWGWQVEAAKGPASWYSEALRDSFGFWWIYVLVLLVSGVSIVSNPRKRILNIMILTWIAPLSLYMLWSVGYKGAHYFIPVFLPGMSLIGNLFELNIVREGTTIRRGAVLGLFAASMLLCVTQFVYYVSADLELYTRVHDREIRSASIGFYRQLHDAYIASLEPGRRLTIVREYRIYYPSSANWNDRASSHIDYAYINEIQPDLILLTRESIDYQSDLTLANRIAPVLREQWQKDYEFFRDAKADSLKGFRKVLETDFAVAFVRAMT
jgi:hypothetical protein